MRGAVFGHDVGLRLAGSRAPCRRPTGPRSDACGCPSWPCHRARVALEHAEPAELLRHVQQVFEAIGAQRLAAIEQRQPGCVGRPAAPTATPATRRRCRRAAPASRRPAACGCATPATARATRLRPRARWRRTTRRTALPSTLSSVPALALTNAALAPRTTPSASTASTGAVTASGTVKSGLMEAASMSCVWRPRARPV